MKFHPILREKKGKLSVAWSSAPLLENSALHSFIYIYIYIYMCVYVCVCMIADFVCGRRDGWAAVTSLGGLVASPPWAQRYWWKRHRSFFIYLKPILPPKSKLTVQCRRQVYATPKTMVHRSRSLYLMILKYLGLCLCLFPGECVLFIQCVRVHVCVTVPEI